MKTELVDTAKLAEHGTSVESLNFMILHTYVFDVERENPVEEVEY